MKNKKNIIVLPKVVYTYNNNSKTPNIEVNKKTDYDKIRDIVEGNNENKMTPKTNENIVNKVINKFQIV
jgi:hypothetical protein